MKFTDMSAVTIPRQTPLGSRLVLSAKGCTSQQVRVGVVRVRARGEIEDHFPGKVSCQVT